VIGVKVLLDMKPSAGGWDGNVYNAKDGAAHIAIRDANTLRIEGCALGGCAAVRTGRASTGKATTSRCAPCAPLLFERPEADASQSAGGVE
jgi:hypothetical protein